MTTIIGFDTETRQGPPITVQFYSQDFPRINTCIFVDDKNVLSKTLAHIWRHKKNGHIVLYGHNLNFDLVSLFWPMKEKLVAKKGEFKFDVGPWEVSGVYGTPTFCKVQRDSLKISIVDGFSWFRTSLAKAADLVCPHLPKLTMPEGLGERGFTAKDDDFVAYAMRDAEVSCYVGHAIEMMHQEFELQQTVSVADMASRIFSHVFIDEPIYNTGPRILEGAVKSYHGGKNNVVSGAAPAWHYPIDAWDLSSAYPHAMTLLPAFSNPKLFAAARVFNKNVNQVPDFGVYCITGRVERCDWPVLFNHDFTPIKGEFSATWVTGFELNEALRMGEVQLTKIWGHIYDADRDPVQETALQRFVDDFYTRKQTAPEPVRRFLFKTILNSISGKFIQSREVENDEGGVRWKHGPLYHPFIASLITGHTRSIMHRLEHETKAIHTATDGIFCGARNSPKDGRFAWAPESGLGSIDKEADGAEICLLRNKCYVLYHDDGKIPSTQRDGRKVLKYATHGYMGNLEQLEALIMHNRRKYSVEKPNTLRTSLRRGLVPNRFDRKDYVLKVPPIRTAFDHSNKGN